MMAARWLETGQAVERDPIAAIGFYQMATADAGMPDAQV